MSVESLDRFGRWTGWLATVLFSVFMANVVAAKLASLAGIRIPLFPDLVEFFLLHGATMAFIAYALVREAQAPPENASDGESSANSAAR